MVPVQLTSLEMVLQASDAPPKDARTQRNHADFARPTVCVKNVVLEVTRDDGEIDRSTLQTDLMLRKEVGNARLVSGDAMLWVGKGVLSHKDSTLDSVPTRTVRVENGKRRFVFTVALDAAGKQFYADLKDQVDGKAGAEIRKKKRKIRKQLSKVMGFTPVNTLKSPVKSSPQVLNSPVKKPPMTPKRSPLADIGTPPKRTPQLTLPPPLPVTAIGPSSLASPLRSPFRSPFRKKVRLSVSPSNGGTPSANVKATSSRSPAREWLSPVRSLKLRSGPTPELKQHSVHTPEGQNTGKSGGSTGSSGEKNRRKSITGSINKRVRSLQLMLDDESAAKNPEAQTQRKITSHFFKKDPPSSAYLDNAARTLDLAMDSASTDENDDKTDASNRSVGESPQDGTQRSTHGLLNLGNYCYMNAIVQALTALPDFVSAVQDENNLLRIIRKQPQPIIKVKTMEQLKSVFEEWRTSGDTKHLPLQYTLNQLLQLVINGSETSINPEPLKNVMGKKNSIFATYVMLINTSMQAYSPNLLSLSCDCHSHFQQDAHEFLLNLVTEYEKELVRMVHEVTEKIQADAKSSPQAQNSSLLNFFRNNPKLNADHHNNKSCDAELELICQLPPAKCFRAELNRTLTCRNCGYNRKQAETFYDFSLDLPYYPIPEPEPTAEHEPQASPPPERQCFCNLAAVTAGEGSERNFCCPKSSCSYREKMTDVQVSATTSAEMEMVTPGSSPESSAFSGAGRPSPIKLETLIQKQFETEVLELTCEKCKVGKEAESAYQVKSLPSILVFHLKRFEVNPHTGALFKRCDPIVPPATIDPTRSINNTTQPGSESGYVLKITLYKHTEVRNHVICSSMSNQTEKNSTKGKKMFHSIELQHKTKMQTKKILANSVTELPMTG
ncbi:unnamed protein product [Phytophthora fragariaefolia]|uniref:Unnamed protein product n=1 Tax=Phytophthora fragariaefolia TaxID=1490495 RepID=A0A9W6WUM2_9STRA|nr:unnamed protein product [Phytophthora fragariaefolia]